IAVMGVTGAGKSTFIQLVSGNEDIEIGHDLRSCTSEIQGYTFHFNGYNINIVDTPGFNDTFKTETQVLQDIADWLKQSYDSETRLNGIIYLHSLVNVRMEGSALRNLKMFRELCGPKPLNNVILATTFWGEVNKELAVKREAELETTSEFWGDMIARGSTMKRLKDRRTALEIIELLVGKAPVTLQIQDELVKGKKLVETEAGKIVNEELMRLETTHKRELEKIQQELQEVRDHDEELQQILEAQQRKLDKELNKVHRQQEQLRYDRRAEKRKMEIDFEARINEIQIKMDMERQAKVRDFNFDQAVALVRANEGKVRPEDREVLERKIAELSRMPE
ncbi:hypothetical protein K432DRAFT_250303, partial [Lepidopterella palustris CBS 459.81]